MCNTVISATFPLSSSSDQASSSSFPSSSSVPTMPITSKTPLLHLQQQQQQHQQPSTNNFSTLSLSLPMLPNTGNSSTSLHTDKTWAGEDKPADFPPMQASVTGSAINLCACALGASMLSLPYTLSLSGPLVALQMLLLFAAMAYVSAQTVVRAGFATRRSTYAGIVDALFGRGLSKLVDLLLGVTLLVAAISYVVGLIDLLPDMFPVMRAVPRSARIVICVVTLFPVTLVGSLAAFGPASTLAVFGCFILALSLLLETLTGPTIWHMPSLRAWTVVDMPGLIYSLPMICFVYAFHYVQCDTLCELRHPTTSRVRRVNQLTVSTLVVVYFVVAVCGFLLKQQYGATGGNSRISPNILADLPANSPPVIVAKWAIGLLLLCTYPLFIIPLRLSIERALPLPHHHQHHHQQHHRSNGRTPTMTHRAVVAGALNASVALAAVMLPDLGMANALAGGCIALVMLFFPGCFTLKLQLAAPPHARSAAQMAVGALFVCVGVVIGFVGVFGSSLFDFVS